MTLASKLETAAAILATLIASAVAVWATGDPRAFGLVVVFAGVLVALAVGRSEWRTGASHDGVRAASAVGMKRAA